MPFRWMVLVAGLFAAGITFAPIKLAQADDWPSRPLTMVVPFAAGGPTDVVGRIVADRLSDALGQHIVVENVGGASPRRTAPSYSQILRAAASHSVTA